MHLAGTFIQSDLQCIQFIHLYCQYMCSLGIEPTTFALLTQCSTTEPLSHRNTFKLEFNTFFLWKNKMKSYKYIKYVQFFSNIYELNTFDY